MVNSSNHTIIGKCVLCGKDTYDKAGCDYVCDECYHKGVFGIENFM